MKKNASIDITLNNRRLSKAACLALAVLPVAGLFSRTASAATDTWASSVSNWSGGSWTGGNTPPVSGDSLIFGGSFFSPSTDDIAGLSVNGITFSAGASAYTLNTASGVTLTLGTPDVPGTTGFGNITNSSSVIQTIAMSLNLNAGDHGIVGGAAATSALAFNPVGGLTRDPGATVIFSGNVTTTTVTNGTGGIIGGYATVGTNWATVSGGSILALTAAGYTDITTTGTINSNPASNVRINSGVAGTVNLTNTTGTTDINTLMQNVDTIAETVTVPTGAVLRFGAEGGIFRTGVANTTNALQITGGSITAGGADNTNGNLTINAGGGTSTGTLMTIASLITDNGTGVVTVTKTGRGYLNMSNSTNSYTGGTFINEGRVGGTGNPLGGGSFGTGNIVISSGGELSGGGTFINNFFIAGSGPQNELGNGALRGGTYNGPIILTGDASLVSTTVNSQISGNFNLTFGSISNTGGTGPTEVLSNVNSNNAWTGNTVLVGRTNGAATNILKLGASEQIPDASTMIIGVSGINAGSVIDFDLNGFNETINGLTSVGGNSTTQFVTNTNAATDSTLTLGSANGGGTFNGAITNGALGHTVNIVKNGTGTQIFAGANTYTGTTTVNSGILLITNSLASATVTVNAGSFGGNGTLAGNVTVASGAHIVPGTSATSGSVGTLVINGASGLTVNGDLTMDLGAPGVNDLITVNGPAIFNSGSTVTLNGGTIGSSYVVLTSNAPITYNATPTVVTTGDPTVRPTVYTLDTTSVATQITVNVVSGGSRTLTWTGANNGTWDINTTTNNWVNTIPTSDVFFNADSVSFTDSGSNKNITITGTVLPANPITVNNSAGNDYTFGGGIIGGTASLNKTGTGNLTVTSNNTYSGGTSIDATSTIDVGGGTAAGGLGTGNIANSGNLILHRTGTYSFANEIDGSGNVTATGGGTVTLSTANTYSGNTNINSGTTVIAGGNTSLGAQGAGTVNISGGGEVDISTGAAAMNFGAKQFNIAGTGATGTGALFDNGTTAKTSAFQKITLTGNSSVFVGASARDDFRNNNPVLELNNFTLTKNGGGQFTLVGATLDGTGANMVVTAGLFSFQTTSHTTGTGTLTEAPGIDAEFYQTGVGNFTWNLVLQGNNTLSSANGTTANVDGPVSFAGNLSVGASNGVSGHADSNSFPLSVNSSMTETTAGSSVTKYSIDTVTLAGSANAWTGGTNITNGTLKLGSSTALPAGTVISMGDANTNVGTLDLNTFNATIGGLSINAANTGNATANVITNSGATPSILTYAGGTSTFAGTIQDGTGGVSLAVTAGSLTLSGNATYTGNTSVNAGASLAFIGSTSLSSTSNVTNNGNLSFAGNPQSLASLNGTTTAASVKLNATALTLSGNGTYAGGISDNGTLGSVTINSGVVQTTGAINVATLNVSGTEKFTNTTIRTLSKVNALNVAGSPGAWTGGLDLTNSRLIVEDSSASRATDLANYKNMVANSVGNTVGIYSSTAAADPTNLAVVVSDNAIRMATFSQGSTNFGTGTNNVDANSILITTTFKGDFNLDGVVDLKDLQDIANHWQQTVTDWSQGDVDGNGKVELQDLQAVANHWQAGVGAPGAGSGGSFSEALSLVGGLGGSGSNVPEPASLALIGLGGIVLATRRKRSR